MEHSPGGTGPPPRRGPTVDLDPTGIVTGKSPDRQRRQFLNYSFYRLDPVFRRLPADERRAAGDRVHRTGAEVGVFGGPDPSHLLARGPARGRGLHALADRVRPALLPVDGSDDQALAAGRLPVAGTQLPFAAAPVAVRQPFEGRRRGRRVAAGPGEVPVRVPLLEDAVVVPPFAPRAAGDDGRAYRRLRAVQGRQPELELQLRHRRSGLRGRVRLGLPAGVRRSGGAAALHGGESLYATGHADVHVREGAH